ncbi:MAG: arsenite efflux transporter metallochaperone ArsD [Anaerolineaceae bacterium]
MMIKQQFKLDSKETFQVRLVDVEIYDPPMCCPTGLCGPTVDQTLLDFSEMILNLQKEGYQVERYQMATQSQAFLDNPMVMRLINEKQLSVLPIVTVRGQVLCEGRYPTSNEVYAKLKGGR